MTAPASGSGDKYVFLSYSRRDAQAADRIMDALTGAGVRVWRDTFDIKPGADWLSSIVKAIEGAGAILYLGSPNSLGSSFVVDKLLRLLRGREKAIIPVRIDEIDFKDVPMELSALQFIDLRRDFDTGIETILSRLRNIGFVPTPRPQPALRAANKGYVFLSYAKEDRHFVAAIVEFFQKKLYAYFDYKDSRRKFEADFDVELEDRLRSAELVACVISPNWKKAVWPKKEYLFANKIGVPTYLLMFEDPGDSIIIIDRTPIDFTGDKSAAFEALDWELKMRRL